MIADVVASGQFLPSSTTYVATVNGQSGAVTIGIPATTTVNGTQATVFNIIGDGTTVTSTVNGATTTFSIITSGNWQGTWQGASSSTFYKASNPSGYISGNQTITFVAAGDATGTATGTTMISDTMTVTGLQGKALPALATGTLKYSGGAWTFDGNTYLTSGINVTTTGPLGGGGPLTSAGLTLTCTTCLTGNQTITLTGAVTGSGTTSIATTYSTSTLYALFSGSGPVTFNTSTGAIGWTNSLNYITGVTVNGQSGTSFSIVAGPGISSTVSGATTTLSLNLGAGCTGGNFVQTISATGTITCAIPSGSFATTTVNHTAALAFVLQGDGSTITSTTSGATTTYSVIPGVYLTPASGTALFYPLTGNPSGFTTTTVQAALNALSVSGCATYATSTGAITVTCLSTSTAATTYVPYTGAKGNVNLGSNSLTAATGTFTKVTASSTLSVGTTAVSASGGALLINDAVPVQAQFGSSIPFYLLSSQPTLGFNVYYNGGWKYGDGSVSGTNDAAELGFDTRNGISAFNLGVASGTGNAGAAVTFYYPFQILQDGEVGIGGFPATSANLSGTAFYIGTTGNVGIGTTTPTAKLTVNGTSWINGTSTFSHANASGSWNYSLTNDGNYLEVNTNGNIPGTPKLPTTSSFKISPPSPRPRLPSLPPHGNARSPKRRTSPKRLAITFVDWDTEYLPTGTSPNIASGWFDNRRGTSSILFPFRAFWNDGRVNHVGFSMTPATNMSASNFNTLVNNGTGYFTVGTATSTTGAFDVFQNGANTCAGIYDSGAQQSMDCRFPPCAFGMRCARRILSRTRHWRLDRERGLTDLRILNSSQSSNGKGHTAFTVYDTNEVDTYNNTLDDGNGNAICRAPSRWAARSRFRVLKPPYPSPLRPPPPPSSKAALRPPCAKRPMAGASPYTQPTFRRGRFSLQQTHVSKTHLHLGRHYRRNLLGNSVRVGVHMVEPSSGRIGECRDRPHKQSVGQRKRVGNAFDLRRRRSDVNERRKRRRIHVITEYVDGSSRHSGYH